MVQKCCQPYCLAKNMKLYIAVCSALLRAPCLWAVFHSSETHYDLGCRETRQMAMSAHISGFLDNHFEQVSDIDNTCLGGF